MFAHNENKRMRELAVIILKNVNDNEFLSTFSNIDNWISSLDLGTEGLRIIDRLKRENVQLHYLLNNEITSDQILNIFRGLGFKAGCIFAMMISISKARGNNELARKQATELAVTSYLKEKDVSINSDKDELATSNISDKNITKKPLFISYCWANKLAVSKIHNILAEKGFGCWIDDNIIQGGSQLFGEIDNGISECQVFISCCSNNYGASVNCKREVNLASDRKKLIIPILVAACEPWPPKGEMGPLLAGKIYINLSNEENFNKNIEQLIAAITQSL